VYLEIRRRNTAVPRLYYLAYGSNLHPQRLADRVPSARFLDVVEMPGRCLAFHKRSNDGSGKCLFYTEQGEEQMMYGALYDFDAADKARLDKAEGLGQGYEEKLMQFSLKGTTYTPYAYTVQHSHIDAKLVPYEWYKRFVLAGARHHNLPMKYVQQIEAVLAKPDPVPERALQQHRIADQLEQA